MINQSNPCGPANSISVVSFIGHTTLSYKFFLIHIVGTAANIFLGTADYQCRSL